ncbi:unnamed protein product [Trifolium pratense]|uniref:Uncharacterized protein n=1 Tax=Trifolium pratense TaxID=57577 RepID=A0ACB0JZF8_TRIPR|nr:unnamed protein product [Trifolium pratense]
MSEESSEINGGFSMDSSESRWVFHEDEDDDVSDIEEYHADLRFRGRNTVPDSEDEDNAEQKLIRTGPRIDSFDVEALDVPGVHRNDYEDISVGKKIVLAFQTLGVVFGDVGTSPLYTFSVMFRKAPINENEDILGALSLVLYTLILIPLVKYVLVVLWANDNGEVLSSVGGLNIGIDAIKQDQVVMISVACLIVLFSVQKYGTSKVGLAVGPALFIWFCSLAGIGIYNLVKYDSSVLRAFNPIHIYYFFKRNSTKAWYSLGGCLLCATGSEAMFADLCYFPVRSVQLTFVFLVLPCLLLGYLGQAAYLMENHADAGHAFYSSVPSGAFWPTFLIANIAALIASRAMTTATFSCIKQSTALGCFPRLKIIHTSRKFMGQIYIPVLNWFLLAVSLVLVCSISSIDEIGNAYGIAEMGVMMTTTVLLTLVMLLIWQIHIMIVLCFAVVFLGLELTFFSSVLCSVADGSWIILVFSVIMFLIMYVWNYGSNLKYETEVKQKLSMDLMRELGSNLGTIRAPGIGLLYNELVKGIPAILGHFLTTLPAIHSMIIFVSIKYVPVPVVPQSERFLFRRVCLKSYHIFRCIARFRNQNVLLLLSYYFS